MAAAIVDCRYPCVWPEVLLVEGIGRVSVDCMRIAVLHQGFQSSSPRWCFLIRGGLIVDLMVSFTARGSCRKITNCWACCRRGLC